MNTDTDLDVGEFGIATRMVQPEPGQGAAEPAGGDSRRDDGLQAARAPPTQAATPGGARSRAEVGRRSTTDGNRHEIDEASAS